MLDEDVTSLGPRAQYQEQEKLTARHLSAYQSLPVGAKASGEAFEDYFQSTRSELRLEQRMIPDRPRKGWMGLMCRGLGPLPDVDKPTLDEFPDARRYRLLPYLTILLPIACALLAFAVFPLATLSPITATGKAVGGEEGQSVASTAIMLVVLAVVVGIFLYVGPRRFRRGLFDAALQEELWFRFGSERWAAGRRMRSCAQFGIAHFLNLFVAVITLGGLALVGGVFMWVYLREYRESGDPRRAAVVSATFHADYNTGVCVLILVAGALVVTSLLA